MKEVNKTEFLDTNCLKALTSTDMKMFKHREIKIGNKLIEKH